MTFATCRGFAQGSEAGSPTEAGGQEYRIAARGLKSNRQVVAAIGSVRRARLQIDNSADCALFPHAAEEQPSGEQ
ncbi:hypothetical protein [Aquibium sp. ELW1220]|uniref:hypothetical protein n=1 Tax=Aquibium sp. ELW1220 TaxID=2976766 RepID=UPI0025B25CE9|nr:hypothetical protein [Aquibium sp. ELW1220]MDN2581572.1 hypothetical protein [Aquibium sp. ELW1220]